MAWGACAVSKRKQRPVNRPKAVQPDRSAKPSAVAADKKWWRTKPVLWSGGVGTAVVGGALAIVLGGVLSSEAQTIVPSPTQTIALAPPNLPKGNTASKGSARHKPKPHPSGPPLTVVSELPLNLDNSGVWVLPSQALLTSDELKDLNARTATSSPGTPGYKLINMMYSLSGYQRGGTNTQLVVQNNQPQEIRVLDMQVLKSCGPPLTGTLVYSPDSGEDPAVQLGFDLDSADTDAQLVNEKVTPSKIEKHYFNSHTVTIKPGAQQVFSIITSTRMHSCTYRFALSMLVGPRHESQVIGDGLEPFRVSALITGDDGTPRFRRYGVVYLGGVASPTGKDTFVRVKSEDAKRLETCGWHSRKWFKKVGLTECLRAH